MSANIKKNILINHCRYCNHEEEVKNDNYIISASILKKEEEDNIINPAICDDSTYPQSKTEKCSNKDCTNSKVIYIIAKKTLQYTYICCQCKESWTN
jgi:hypothetical protein